MERLTIPDVIIDKNTIRRTIIDASEVRKNAMKIYWRLKEIEDIISDDESEEYDLGRLHELAQADREGRCVVFQPGYALVSIYNPADEDGLYTMKVTGVITKEEYEAALRREQG